jgi:hypothetical protein
MSEVGGVGVCEQLCDGVAILFGGRVVAEFEMGGCV